MASPDRREAFDLLVASMQSDPAGRERFEAGVGAALSLFIERPDYGFVYMAFDGTQAVACATVSYAISLAYGTVVAEVENFVVAPQHRREGVGSAFVESLEALLRVEEVGRLDVIVAASNAPGTAFYRSLGFDDDGQHERLTLGL